MSTSLNLDNIMKTVMEIVNYICTHALNHQQFKNLIAELDQGFPGDLPLHCTVRWLSKSQVLSRFFQLLDAVKLFIKENKNNPELLDLRVDYEPGLFSQHVVSLEQIEPEFVGQVKNAARSSEKCICFCQQTEVVQGTYSKRMFNTFSNSAKSQRAIYRCCPE